MSEKPVVFFPGKLLIDEGLAALDVSASDRKEAIRALIDLLEGAGRLLDRRAVEEAVTRREEKGSTALEHGFALPHCNSAGVRATSIAYLRLRQPIVWDAVNGAAVRHVFLLALQASDTGREQLQIMARLSRLLMEPSFRRELDRVTSPPALSLLLGSFPGQ